jgi:hypothetical protein
MDTTNHFWVGLRGQEIVIARQIRGAMTKEAALNLAAWLVVLADVNDEKFNALLAEIRST